MTLVKSVNIDLLEDFIEFDYLGVGTESTQGLNFSQIVDLLDGVEVVLHAFDGDVLASLDALGLEDLREGPLALFRYQSVLYTNKISYRYEARQVVLV